MSFLGKALVQKADYRLDCHYYFSPISYSSSIVGRIKTPKPKQVTKTDGQFSLSYNIFKTQNTVKLKQY